MNEFQDEPNYTKLYAALCQLLAESFDVPQRLNSKNSAEFKNMLAAKCQKEFDNIFIKDDRATNKQGKFAHVFALSLQCFASFIFISRI